MSLDNFLETFPALLKASKDGDFEGAVSPIDGVKYPYICQDIPEEVRQEIEQLLSDYIGKDIKQSTMFMRRSPEGVEAPHQVHSDISMGDYSLMLYINQGESAGTSIVKHKDSGIAYSPGRKEFLDIITHDQNNPEAWEVVYMVSMKPNRAFIFRADTLHRAEPIGGFGEGKEARVVLTCFFS